MHLMLIMLGMLVIFNGMLRNNIIRLSSRVQLSAIFAGKKSDAVQIHAELLPEDPRAHPYPRKPLFVPPYGIHEL